MREPKGKEGNGDEFLGREFLCFSWCGWLLDGKKEQQEEEGEDDQDRCTRGRSKGRDLKYTRRGEGKEKEVMRVMMDTEQNRRGE